jgi:hypothetical protein
VTTANTHNAGAVAHNEQLATVGDQAFFFSNSAETKNELKPLKPGAIKVETRFRYHFGLLQPKKYSQQKLNHFRNQPQNRPVSFTVNTMGGFIGQ